MDELGPRLAAALLLALRWFVALRLQPHWSLMLGRLWWVVSAGLALSLAASVEGPGVELDSASAWVVAVVAEVAFGAVLGVVVSLPAYALLMAASASAGAFRTAPVPFVRMCVAAALVAALALRMHHPALVVLHDQAAAFPPGAPAAWQHVEVLSGLVVQLDAMLMLALTLSTPVLLTVVVLRAATAIVGAGPDVAKHPSDALGPALATAAALLAFAASWSVYPVGWARAAVAAP